MYRSCYALSVTPELSLVRIQIWHLYKCTDRQVLPEDASGQCDRLSGVRIVGSTYVLVAEAFIDRRMGRSARRKQRAGQAVCMAYMHNGQCPGGTQCPYLHESFNEAFPALLKQQTQPVEEVRCCIWPAIQGLMPSHSRQYMSRTYGDDTQQVQKQI